MSNVKLDEFIQYGTNAQRLVFTPSPASGTQPIYIWYETDTNNVYFYTTAWQGPFKSATSGITSVSLTGQTASIATTTIVTPSADGLFEVAVLHLVSVAGTAGTVQTVIGWTDEQGAHSRVIATNLDLTNASDQESGSAIVRAKTTAPITYTVTVTGATGAPQFDLFINVRAL